MTPSLLPAPFERRTIPALLEERARAAPHDLVLSIAQCDYTAAGLVEETDRIAGGLMALGIGPGMSVGLMSSNRAELVLVWLALARLGAVAVPINAALKARQLAYVLGNSRARALIVEDRLLPEFGADLEGDVEQVIVIGDPGEKARRPGLQVSTYDTLKNGPAPGASALVAPTDLASIMYTGGTTGPSKGVMCSQSQYYWWAFLLARSVGLTNADVWYTCLPFFHINAQGTFLATVLAGASTAAGDRFSASRYWEQTRACGATIGSLLGTMAHILYHERPPGPEDRQHSLRIVFCPAIGAAIHLDFERRFGVRIVNAYGSTELNCVTMTDGDRPSVPGSMGEILEEFEMKVVDEADQEVPRGTAGELIVRPREPFSTMLGYFGMPEKTMAACRNLWFHTGDRGFCDKEGRYFFVDRLKDSIRRRGENVSSFEVQQVVDAHEAVLESAAYPVPAVEGEDEVMVSVVFRPDMAVALEEIVRWCEERLPSFAVPRYINIVSELPKTAVGRVEKFKLREAGVTASTWDRLAQATTMQRGRSAPAP